MAPEYEAIIARPTLSVVEAGLLLGLGRNSAYEACRRGYIPTIRLGRRIRVPTARLQQMLLEGMQAAEKQPATKSGPSK
jgi:excisionase family DNA binding protein